MKHEPKTLRIALGLALSLLVTSSTPAIGAAPMNVSITASANATVSIGQVQDQCSIQFSANLVYLPDPVTGTYKTISEQNYSISVQGSGSAGGFSWTYTARQPGPGSASAYYQPLQNKVTVGWSYLTDFVVATPQDAGLASGYCKIAEDNYLQQPDSGVVRLPPTGGSGSGSGQGNYADGLAVSEFKASYTVSLAGRKLTITSIETPTPAAGSYSFVGTDTIKVTAQLDPPLPGVDINWEVKGLGPAAGVQFPNQRVKTDAAGTTVLSFTPAAYISFNWNRTNSVLEGAWATGGPNPNLPIGFEVTAQDRSHDPPIEAKSSTLGAIVQDETDTLRQEYFDFQGQIPPRDEIIPTIGPGYNKGNYTVQRNFQMKERYQKILNAFRNSTMTIDGQSVPIGAQAQLTVGGFRCPRRNVYAGSLYPVTSFHTRGRALDLVPVLGSVTINGKRRALKPAEIHSQVYPALLTAAKTQGSALTEDGPIPVPAGCNGCVVNGAVRTEDHVHVQWK